MNIANNPQPWLSRAAKEWLNQNIHDDWVVLEFGGGSSSIWFLPRCKWLFTIEHNKEWYDLIKTTAQRLGHINLTAFRMNRPYYLDIPFQFPREFFELILVDGRDRVECAKASYGIVKPGGYLMLDDAQRKKYNPVREDMKKMGWEFTGEHWKPGCKDNKDRLTLLWRKPECNTNTVSVE